MKLMNGERQIDVYLYIDDILNSMHRMAVLLDGWPLRSKVSEISALRAFCS